MNQKETRRAVCIALPVFDRDRESPCSSETEVERSLKRLEDLLGMTFRTQRTGPERTGDSWTTSATRNGRDVTFADGVHKGNRYTDILGLSYGDSRSSALHYALDNAVELSTDEETLEIPCHARTVRELQMKASICGGMEWKRKDAHGNEL